MPTHKDLEFAVDDASGRERVFKTFGEACGFAVALAACTGQDVNVDVLCWSEDAATAFGIDDYDHEASVTERIVIKADATGKVP